MAKLEMQYGEATERSGPLRFRLPLRNPPAHFNPAINAVSEMLKRTKR